MVMQTVCPDCESEVTTSYALGAEIEVTPLCVNCKFKEVEEPSILKSVLNWFGICL